MKSVVQLGAAIANFFEEVKVNVENDKIRVNRLCLLGRVGSLLGALAFAGAGGSTNLGQSNFIKDKGYGMGQFIGRITSPLTGQQEAIASTGFLFPDSPENSRRWLGWWRSANIEHLLSFFVTCVICLCLM